MTKRTITNLVAGLACLFAWTGDAADRNPQDPAFQRGLESRKRQFVERGIDPAQVEAVFADLKSLDPEQWVARWTRLAGPYEKQAAEYERQGKKKEAMEAYLKAFALYRAARFPVIDSPAKQRAYRQAIDRYLKAARYFDPPLEVVRIPLAGKEIIGYLRVPPGGRGGKRPLVIETGGVDVYKEDRSTEMYLKEGLATFAVDMPGAGESPVRYTADAHRVYSAMLDYFQTRPEVDPHRIAIVGRSYGGYWGAKMAFVEAKRLRAAVNWGGPVHHGFQEPWLRKLRDDRLYLWDILDSFAYAHGVDSFEALLRQAPGCSLKSQGWLDQRSAPLLVINGAKDEWIPIEDLHLLLQQGNPKSARVYPEHGHMGGPDAAQVVVQWLKEQLLDQ